MKEISLKKKNILGAASRIAVSIVIIALIIWKYDELKNIDVRTIVDSAGSFGLAVLSILGVYFLKSMTFVVPASIVYIAVGLVFDPVVAILINCAGILIEVTVTYILGRVMGGKSVVHKIEGTKYGYKLLKMQSKNKLSALLAIRFLPVFPIDIVSLLLGATRTPFGGYLATSLGGILPRVILFTILGDGLYNYIPMKKLVIFAVILVPVALVVWVVRYIIKSRKEAKTGGLAYIPLKEGGRSVILDTDIGPDCDDAGALALLAYYSKKYSVPVLGVANCTSNKYGNGAIKAILNFCGLEDVPTARHKGISILENNKKYNKAVTEKYFENVSDAVKAEDDEDFYKKVLKKQKDNSVTLITIGPLTNICAILKEDPELFNEKVHSLVCMAGKFPDGKEFNIEEDVEAAKFVFENFKKTTVFSGFEVGEKIMTGYSEKPENAENNPIYDCYRLYSGNENPPYLRESWDLTAVQYAFEGNGNFYETSKPVTVEISDSGRLKSEKEKYSRKHYIIKKAPDSEIAGYLNKIINSFNK